jgi:hypothetical protein
MTFRLSQQVSQFLEEPRHLDPQHWKGGGDDLLNLLPMLIWIHAPKGFRPSNWVDMLCDMDEAFDLDNHLLEPSYITVESRRHYVLQVSCSLLDESAPEKERREALFREMMSRVAALGLLVTVPDKFGSAFPGWWDWLREFCAQNRIVLRSHHPPQEH